jgi:hypothetical protein
MPPALHPGKLYPIFTSCWPNLRLPGAMRSGETRGWRTMVGLAAMMFVALFGWGHQYFHWSDPHGRVQLALFTSFILGIICGYKTKG